MKTQKLLFKEAAIILAALIFAYVAGYYYDSYNYASLYLYSLLALIIFIPLLVLIFMRIRCSQKLDKLSLVMKIFLWPSLALFILIFIGGIYFKVDPLFDSPFSSAFLSFPKNITYAIGNFFTLNYWSSGDWLEWPNWVWYNLQELPIAIAYYSPYLIMIALLSWAGFVNKKMELKNY